MTIECKLCNRVFEKIISSTHLKYSHDITSNDYKKQFGENSLASEDYRKARQLALSGENNPMFGKKHTEAAKQAAGMLKKGKTAHNKGKKVTDQTSLDNIRTAIRKREENYKINGNHPMKNKKLTNETREKISRSISTYAANNKELLKKRAKKMLNTKKENGYDFTSPMRGKKHSDASKEKITLASQKTAKSKMDISWKKYETIAKNSNIKLVNRLGKIITIQCLKCENQFDFTNQYFTDSKFRTDICPYCRDSQTKSKDELKILDYVRTLTDEVVLCGNRSTIFPLEIDILIPSKNLAIEYCGLYWHSELLGKEKDYHIVKHNLCKEKNIRLITIFEDEWKNNSDIVKSRLSTIINKSQNIIFGRFCEVKKISIKDAELFCEENHMQGSDNNTAVSYGIFYKNKLLSVMTLSNYDDITGYELNRFCNLKNYSVIGGASKLLSMFIKDYDPEKIISYSDIRWNTGDLYEKIGFTKIETTPPDYWYIDTSTITRIHKSDIEKNVNKNQKWNRIWDCGSDKWEWHKKSGE